MDDDVITEVRNRLQSEIRETEPTAEPIFYSITGSHLYGYANSDSDLDLTGFHAVDDVQYLKIEDPQQTVELSASLSSSDLEIDITSHELREFGRRCYTSQYQSIEAVFASEFVLNPYSEDVSRLRRLIQRFLPADLCERYEGMARSLYTNHLSNGDEIGGDASLDLYLYSLRGILAAKYVKKHNEVESSLETLSGELLPQEDEDRIQVLMEAKRENNLDRITNEELEEILALISGHLSQFTLPTFTEDDRENYRQELNQSMVDIRQRINHD